HSHAIRTNETSRIPKSKSGVGMGQSSSANVDIDAVAAGALGIGVGRGDGEFAAAFEALHGDAGGLRFRHGLQDVLHAPTMSDPPYACQVVWTNKLDCCSYRADVRLKALSWRGVGRCLRISPMSLGRSCRGQ